MTDLIALSPDPVSADEAIAHVACAEAGGIDVFLGVTRAEMHPQFGALEALDYDAYEEMALSELHRLVAQARAKWGVCRAAVVHRIGRCRVGEASVVIAVSCAHRDEAFSACRFLIDELKKSVPIWKRDVYQHAAPWRHEREGS